MKARFYLVKILGITSWISISSLSYGASEKSTLPLSIEYADLVAHLTSHHSSLSAADASRVASIIARLQSDIDALKAQELFLKQSLTYVP